MKKNFLKDNKGNFSSMRLALLIVCIIGALLGLSMVVYIIITAFKDGQSPEWSQMGVFLGSIGVFLGIAITGKVFQNKDENKLP